MVPAAVVEIDFRKTARQNAADYFERAKRARGKAERARRMLAETPTEKPAGKPAAAGRRREWFEKFRSFVSSEGNLVLAGRDAATNELLIKKHAGPADTVFHSDAAGSPFVVVRGRCGEKTLAEAAVFCASYSKAWQARLAAADVYWVTPDQVRKTALPGEYLVRGSFMIYGKKNYFKDTVLKLYVSLKDGRPAAAPLSEGESVGILPGGTPREEAIKEIKRRLGFEGRDDEIDRVIPPGKVELTEAER